MVFAAQAQLRPGTQSINDQDRSQLVSSASNHWILQPSSTPTSGVRAYNFTCRLSQNTYQVEVNLNAPENSSLYLLDRKGGRSEIKDPVAALVSKRLILSNLNFQGHPEQTIDRSLSSTRFSLQRLGMNDFKRNELAHGKEVYQVRRTNYPKIEIEVDPLERLPKVFAVGQGGLRIQVFAGDTVLRQSLSRIVNDIKAVRQQQVEELAAALKDGTIYSKLNASRIVKAGNGESITYSGSFSFSSDGVFQSSHPAEVTITVWRDKKDGKYTNYRLEHIANTDHGSLWRSGPYHNPFIELDRATGEALFSAKK